MKRSTSLMICMAAVLMLSGCATTSHDGSAPLIGRSLTFTMSEPAPAKFDSWTFFWAYPSLERFDADLEYVVIADGKEYYVHDCGMVSPGVYPRSDFWKTMFTDAGEPDRDLITPFHGKTITVVFRATKGRLRFPANPVRGFAFYRNDKNGKPDRQNPIKQIEAVLE